MDKPTAIILIGPSGSGKSTYAKKIGHKVVSADDYFMVDGKYCFDVSKLSEAHGKCLRDFIMACATEHSVIVDNTNTTIAEIAPYIAIAQAYKIDVLVFVMPADSVDTFAARNVHNVPVLTIRKQFERIRSLLNDWPKHWPSWSFAHL